MTRGMTRSLTGRLSAMISKHLEEEERRLALAEGVNEDDYEVYEPLLAGLNDHEQTAALQNLWFLLRRIILVFSVFFLADNYWQWLQMVIFMLSSLAAITYECWASPFDSRY